MEGPELFNPPGIKGITVARTHKEAGQVEPSGFVGWTAPPFLFELDDYLSQGPEETKGPLIPFHFQDLPQLAG